MGYLVYKDGRKKFLPDGQALKLWKSINDPTNLTPSQIEKLGTITRIFINYYQAPESYVLQNIDWIAAIEVGRWSVSSSGSLSRPIGQRSWDFARKYGLWLAGAPTELAQTAFTG